MKSELIENLLNHMQWADAEVWKKVLSFEKAENDERIKKLLYHLHQVQYAFYFLWNDLPVENPKPEQFVNLKSIAKWGFEYQQKLKEFLATSKANENEKVIQIPWAVFMERRIGKKVVPATLEETILQVASHSTYHRGQINSQLREIGGEPPMTDFIAWVWLGKPKESWENIF
ncbi:MAG TPA: DinB family protein [Ignavibacteriaceae bacterium]|nr:DinB family protein [Ignavibacteriaceae bacterium]